jgi:hypothetical protein
MFFPKASDVNRRRVSPPAARGFPSPSTCSVSAMRAVLKFQSYVLVMA